MRNQFALLCSLLIFLGSCSNTANDSDVQERGENAIWEAGKYYYTDSLFGNFLIKRQDSIQMEYLKMHQLEVQFKLAWLNDSMYTLRFDQVNQNPNDISLPHDLDSLIKTCTITSVTDTSYIEKATSNLNKEVNLTTIYLVKSSVN